MVCLSLQFVFAQSNSWAPSHRASGGWRKKALLPRLSGGCLVCPPQWLHKDQGLWMGLGGDLVSLDSCIIIEVTPRWHGPQPALFWSKGTLPPCGPAYEAVCYSSRSLLIPSLTCVHTWAPLSPVLAPSQDPPCTLARPPR